MTADISRREFLKRSAAFGAGVALASGALPRVLAAGERDFYVPPFDLAIAKGSSPAKNCLEAVSALGGFGKFVRKGDKVVVKPNPVGENPPERAINTHPDMVEAVIRECRRAGAKEVVVVSHDSAGSFAGNGIQTAVEKAGGILRVLQDRDQFREVFVPRGRILHDIAISTDVLDADVFINMPIAKHHGASRVTLAMKNLMGVNWDRITFHRTDLHRCIAELTSAVRHSLVILDANHVLLTNGPSGPGEVRAMGQVIAGVDPVAVDAFATRFFDLEPDDVGYIRSAYDLGVGEVDIAQLEIREFDV
jgi:uncharacterized protein (DUF362 family)